MAMTDTSNKSFLANNQFTDNDNKSTTTTSSSAAGTEPVAAPVPPVHDEHGSGSHTVGGTAPDNKDPQEDGQNGNENEQPEPKPSEDPPSPSPNPEEPPVMPDVDTDEHEPDIWEQGYSDNPSDSDDFWEENKDLLRQVQNILDFRYPSSNISLADIIAAACQFRGGLSGGEGEGADGENTPHDVDTHKPEPDPQSIEDESIAKGFCKIYKTSLDEFSKAVNAKLFDNTEYSFDDKKPDDQKDIANAVDIEKYNAEFKNQDEVRIEQLRKAVNAIVEKLQNNKPDDKFNEKTIIAQITDYSRTDETVVFNYISYLLKVFYDKWLLPDGSGDRFPYVINNAGNEDVGPRENDAIIKEYWNNNKYWKYKESEYYKKIGEKATTKSIIKQIEKDSKFYGSKYYRFVKINGKYFQIAKYIDDKYISEEKYLKLEKKSKYLSTPLTKGSNKYYYKINDTGKHILANNEIHDYVAEKLEWYEKIDDENYSITYDIQLYNGGDSNSILGKGFVELMQEVAKTLYENYKLLNKTDLNNRKGENSVYHLKDYLHDFGIGMDCSGYVTRALAYVMCELMVPPYIQVKTIGPGWGRLRTNGQTLDLKGGSRLYHTTSSNKNDTLEALYSKLQIGDIEMKGQTVPNGKFHIRIINDVGECESPDNKSIKLKYYSDHQSSSTNGRIGVIETKVVDSVPKGNNNYKSYEKHKVSGTYYYRFARPYVFDDPERLKGFFIEMLKHKGAN